MWAMIMGKSPWGVTMTMIAADAIKMSTTTSSMITILPARRVGRSRCKAVHHHPWLRDLPPNGRHMQRWERPQPVWCPAESRDWNPIPHLLEANAQFVCGGHGAARGRGEDPPLKIKARLEGRIWTVDAKPADSWGDVQLAFASKWNISITDFELTFNNQQVEMPGPLPLPNQYGHIHVDAVRLEQRPGRRATPRQRSRTPSRPMQPQNLREAHTHMNGWDMEALYFRVRAHQGDWILKLALEEMNAVSWQEVTVSQAAEMLQRLYPNCIATHCRLCIAANQTLLRPDACLIQYVQDPATQLHLLPSPLLGASRQGESWDFSEDSGSEPSSEAEPPPHMYVLWRQGGVFYPHRVNLPDMSEMTWLQLEALLLEQHPMLRFWGRPIFANLSGQVLGLSTRIRPSTTPAILAFPSPEVGAGGDDIFNEALAIAKNAAADCHKVNQLKLLLRGEPGLQGRLVKNGRDSKRCRAILLDLGLRYGLARQNGAPPAEVRATSAPPVATRNVSGDREWKTVAARRPPVTSSQKLELLQEDWSVPALAELPFDAPGICIASSQTEAEAMARRLGKPAHPAAIVSLHPVSSARASSQATFRALATDQTGRVKEKTLTGFLNQLGDQDVHTTRNVIKLEAVTDKTASFKAIVKAKKQFLDAKQWSTITAIKDKRSWMQYLTTLKLQCVDFWDVRQDDTTWSAAIRIKKADAKQWLTIPAPFTLALAGAEAEGYKVTWDADSLTVNAARDRYVSTPGFAGIIAGRDSLGVRIVDSAYDSAVTYLGKPLGDVYEVRGVPLHATESVLEPLLEQASWPVTFVHGFRKVVRGAAIFKVRAVSPPPCDMLRINFDGELVHVQLAKLHQRKPAQNNSSTSHSALPTSWEASARMTLGIQRPVEQPAPPPNAQEHDMEADDDDEFQPTEDEMQEPTPAARSPTSPWDR